MLQKRVLSLGKKGGKRDLFTDEELCLFYTNLVIVVVVVFGS